MTHASMREAAPDAAFERQEHRELTQGLERIERVAELADGLVRRDLRLALGEVVRWCDTVLMPHLRWEEVTLYPEYRAAAGTPWATRGLEFEHVQLRRRIDRLRDSHDRMSASPTRAEGAEVRWMLCGVDTLLRAHMECEEGLFRMLPEAHVEAVTPV